MYSLWGRLSFEGESERRAGRRRDAQRQSGPAAEELESVVGARSHRPKGAPVTSPAARFVQWKATLTADSAGHSPELESVDVAYLPKNVEPRIDEIEITPPNYKFPASSTPLLSLIQPQQTLTLPPLGRHGSSPSFTLGQHDQYAGHATLQGLRSARAGWRPTPMATP